MNLTVQIPEALIAQAVATEVAAQMNRRFAAIQTPAVQIPAADRALGAIYRRLQCEMFGAVRDAGLDNTDREGMLRAINVTLGTSYTSRTEMTPTEMIVFTRALGLGMWVRGWHYNPVI